MILTEAPYGERVDRETVNDMLDRIGGFIDQMKQADIYVTDVMDDFRELENALDRLGVVVA